MATPFDKFTTKDGLEIENIDPITGQPLEIEPVAPEMTPEEASLPSIDLARTPAAAPSQPPSELFKMVSDQYARQNALGKVGLPEGMSPAGSGSGDGVGGIISRLKIKSSGAPSPDKGMDFTPSPAPKMDSGYGKELDDAAMKAAMENRNMNQFIARIGKASSQAGDAFGRTETDKSIYNSLEQGAGQGVEDIKTRRSGKDQEIKREVEMIQLANEKDKNDPSSAASKVAQGVLVNMGVKPDLVSGMSVASMEKIFGPIEKWFSAKEARAQRAHELEIKKIDKDIAAKAKIDDKNDMYAKELGKELRASKPFKEYQDIKNKHASIMNSIKNASAFGDIAAVFSFMKSIDPNSVVRESEFATASQAAGLYDRVLNTYGKMEAGTRLQPSQRAEIEQISKHMMAAARDNYNEFKRSSMALAEKRGIDPKLVDSLDEGFETNTMVRVQAPSKDGKPGKIKSIPKSDLKAAIEAGGKLVD